MLILDFFVENVRKGLVICSKSSIKYFESLSRDTLTIEPSRLSKNRAEDQHASDQFVLRRTNGFTQEIFRSDTAREATNAWIGTPKRPLISVVYACCEFHHHPKKGSKRGVYVPTCMQSTMLAHLKAKHREYTAESVNCSVGQAPPVVPETERMTSECPSAVAASHPSPPCAAKPPALACCVDDDEKAATQMTCDVLCSLSSSYPAPACRDGSPAESPVTEFIKNGCSTEKRKASKSSSSCPKQHQLPMFLSSECFFSMSEDLVAFAARAFFGFHFLRIFVL